MEAGTPILLLKDLNLIKHVTVKEFDYFVDCRIFFNKDDGTLGQMLPSLVGDKLKGARSAVSPTFATGKIRRMMEIF